MVPQHGSVVAPRHESVRSNGSVHTDEPGLRLEDLQGGPSGAPRHDRQESSSSEEPGLKLEDLLGQPGKSLFCKHSKRLDLAHTMALCEDHLAH